MPIWRIIVCVLLPPLAVADKGLNSFLIVLILTILGWLPGVVGAIIICNNTKRYNSKRKRK
jgi:uncharacterized membrane protein YqaE (UPF0057 family)